MGWGSLRVLLLSVLVLLPSRTSAFASTSVHLPSQGPTPSPSCKVAKLPPIHSSIGPARLRHSPSSSSSPRSATTRASPTMITDKIALLQTANIILASGSPRRQEILNTILKLGVDVVPSTFEENLDKSQFTPATYVKENARQKALEVWGRLRGEGKRPDLVIGSDTVVARGGQILEKPRDEPHAVEMLKSLSGDTHEVYSGVALIYPPADPDKGPEDAKGETCFTEATEVTFAALSDPVIRAYVASGEPMDKAGGYGIQEVGGSFVSGIRGDYFNVMGFPMHAFCRELSTLVDEGKVLRKG